MTDKLSDEAPELYDNCFSVKESSWKTWTSFNEKGFKLVTSLSKQICIEATRFYLKSEQKISLESVKTYERIVGGKL